MSIQAIIILFFVFIGFLLLILISKKLYFRFKLKKVFYIIPRLSTTGIASVGMILSLSITVMLLLITFSAGIFSLVFRLWAGTRIIFEGILIKIGGLMFGPIIGICLGAAIDLLTITYTGGIFHYGYFISAILFGLFGGLIRMIITSQKSSTNLRFCLFSSLFTLLIVGVSAFIIWYSNIDNVSLQYVVSIMSIDISISLETIISLIIVIPCSGLVILWLCYFINRYQLKKNPDKKDWFIYFAPVFIVVMVTEVVVNVVFMPTFDATISPLGYQAWLAIRLLLLCPMILLNVIIILPIYKIINPLMKYKYEDELVADISKRKYHDKKEYKHG